MRPAARTDTTANDFLNGRLSILQPRDGYRAGTDPVLLAAAVPASPGDAVLDLGSGVGTAVLCLAARVPGLEMHALEIQPDYAALARQNAARTNVSLHVHTGDVVAMPEALRARVFNAVLTNPPWHEPTSVASPKSGKDRANRLHEGLLTLWIGAALSRLRQGGHLVAIIRTEQLPELLGALTGRAGSTTVLPLQGRIGQEAKRVIVRTRKTAKGPFRIASPLVLHTGPRHLRDEDDYTPEARAILRDAGPLQF